MAQAQMKWHNLNLSFRLKVNDGAGYIITIMTLFGYCVLAQWIKPMADNFGYGLGAIVLVAGEFFLEKHGSNKLDVEAAKAGNGTATALGAIKAAAAGLAGPTPCPPEDKGGAR